MSKKTSMMVIVILFAISLLCRWLFVPVQAIELFESGTVDWVEQLDPDLQEQLESYGISMEHPEELQQFSVGWHSKGNYCSNTIIIVIFSSDSLFCVAACGTAWKKCRYL